MKPENLAFLINEQGYVIFHWPCGPIPRGHQFDRYLTGQLLPQPFTVIADATLAEYAEQFKMLKAAGRCKRAVRPRSGYCARCITD